MLIYDELHQELILGDMDNKICKIMSYVPEGYTLCNLLNTSYPDSGYDFFINVTLKGKLIAVPKANQLACERSCRY